MARYENRIPERSLNITFIFETYEGEYQFDKRHGLGSYQWPTGAKFTGSFWEDMKDGQGVYVSESGEKFEVLQITVLVLIHTLLCEAYNNYVVLFIDFSMYVSVR